MPDIPATLLRTLKATSSDANDTWYLILSAFGCLVVFFLRICFLHGFVQLLSYFN